MPLREVWACGFSISGLMLSTEVGSLDLEVSSQLSLDLHLCFSSALLWPSSLACLIVPQRICGSVRQLLGIAVEYPSMLTLRITRCDSWPTFEMYG